MLSESFFSSSQWTSFLPHSVVRTKVLTCEDRQCRPSTREVLLNRLINENQMQPYLTNGLSLATARCLSLPERVVHALVCIPGSLGPICPIAFFSSNSQKQYVTIGRREKIKVT